MLTVALAVAATHVGCHAAGHTYEPTRSYVPRPPTESDGDGSPDGTQRCGAETGERVALPRPRALLLGSLFLRRVFAAVASRFRPDILLHHVGGFLRVLSETLRIRRAISERGSTVEEPSGPLSRPRGPEVGQIRTRAPRRVRLPADLEWPVECATRFSPGAGQRERAGVDGASQALLEVQEGGARGRRQPPSVETLCADPPDGNIF
ncbi:unnamed protein product [Boreogadus saida]